MGDCWQLTLLRLVKVEYTRADLAVIGLMGVVALKLSEQLLILLQRPGRLLLYPLEVVRVIRCEGVVWRLKYNR